MTHGAFTELLESHRNRVYTQALYCLRDRRDAEDVTQECFLRLWKHGPEIPADRIGSWLSSVTRNLCIDQTRRRASARRHFGVADSEALGNLAAGGSGTDESTDILELDDRQQALLGALQALPLETRSIVLMHYFEDRRLADIASALGKSVSAVKVQIHRARRRLRQVLGDEAFIDVSARKGLG